MKMIYDEHDKGAIVEDHMCVALLDCCFTAKPQGKVTDTYIVSEDHYRALVAEVPEAKPDIKPDIEADKKAKKADYMRTKRAAEKAAKNKE